MLKVRVYKAFSLLEKIAHVCLHNSLLHLKSGLESYVLVHESGSLVCLEVAQVVELAPMAPYALFLRFESL